MKNTLPRLGVWPGIACLAIAFAVPSYAKNSPANQHLACTGSTVCSSGGTSLVTLSSSPTFNIVNVGGAESGTEFLAVLVPNATASFTVSVNGGSGIAAEESITFTGGHLGDSGNLNELSLSDFEFSALASASGQAGVTATSFTVYEFNLGTYSNGMGVSVNGSLPKGSVIIAWLENGSGKALDRTPLSESLTSGAHIIPEPASLALFGTGLVAVGGVLRRRKTAA